MTPRFVPFAAMTDAEQREHLRRVHGCDCDAHLTDFYRPICHDSTIRPPGYQPHTHDKPAPRTEENR